MDKLLTKRYRLPNLVNIIVAQALFSCFRLSLTYLRNGFHPSITMTPDKNPKKKCSIIFSFSLKLYNNDKPKKDTLFLQAYR